jgi:hypothetical protein
MFNGIYATFLCVMVFAGRDPPDKKENPMSVDVTKALVARNVPPKLVIMETRKLPLFSDNFDWENQSQVRRAFAELGSRALSDLEWKQLLAHRSDKDYSLTMTEDGRYARNYTVGDLCALLIDHNISAGFRMHLPVRQDGRPIVVSYPRVPIDNETTDSLLLLQIKGCKEAIENIEDEDQRRKSIELIRSELKKMEQSRTPAFYRFPTDGFDLFDRDTATQIKRKIGSTS